MHLVYLDESGNTGTNLNDTTQPVFVLGALIVPAACWQALESDLEQAIVRRFPEIAETGVEIHGGELRSGREHFKGVEIAQRLALRDDWFGIAQAHGLKFVYRAIEKARFQNWSLASFGAGIRVNPHVAAFALVARVVDDYLRSVSNDSLGIFISDENKEVVRDVEKSIRVLRVTDGALRLTRIIEKGFFIDSRKSRPLQLCDICTLAARKLEEAEVGRELKPIDESGREKLEPLIHRGNEALGDVLKWLIQQRNQTA